jgi:uncharacterized damage-inducible protein DinB
MALGILRDLIAHKGYANAALLATIRQHDAAAADAALRQLLEHVRVANRYWLLTILGRPFDRAAESRASASIDELIGRFRRLQEEESAWIGSAAEADLARVLESPQIPGGRCTVAEALVQICMHSHGHRAQCAKLIRGHGVVPPMTDFIWWQAHRPAPAWA